MNLIKSNSHNNGLEVYKGDGIYYKTAIKKEANHLVEREQDGYNWFGVNTGLTRDTFYTLAIPEFTGQTFPLYNKISGNEKHIERLIRFYVKYWRENKFAVHGDLCLCNVILGEKVHIIDWEHFHYSNPDFFGVDIVNMLFIQLHYEYRWLARLGFNWTSFIKHDTLMFLRWCITLLGRNGFLRAPFRNTHWYINKYMNKDKFLLGRLEGDLAEKMFKNLDWVTG